MSAESLQKAASEFTNSNLEVLLSEDQIRQRVNELGAQISAEYANGDVVLIAILKGSCVFLADLMRAIDLRLTIDFMSVSSYKDLRELKVVPREYRGTASSFFDLNATTGHKTHANTHVSQLLRNKANAHKHDGQPWFRRVDHS